MVDFRSPSVTHPLSRARGHGSAKDGTGHWVWQRLTAIALVPTTVWFLYNIITILTGAAYASVQAWAAQPLNAIMLAILFIAMPAHAKMGVQVIIEDYIHTPGTRTMLLVVNLATFWVMGIISIFAIARLHFGLGA